MKQEDLNAAEVVLYLGRTAYLLTYQESDALRVAAEHLQREANEMPLNSTLRLNMELLGVWIEEAIRTRQNR